MKHSLDLYFSCLIEINPISARSTINCAANPRNNCRWFGIRCHSCTSSYRSNRSRKASAFHLSLITIETDSYSIHRSVYSPCSYAYPSPASSYISYRALSPNRRYTIGVVCSSVESAGSRIGITLPSFTKTGMRSSGASTVTVLPPAYLRPVSKSYQSQPFGR